MTARTPRAISNDAFHQIKADYPERSFVKGLLEGRITERDITLIRSFIAEMQSSRNSSTNRTYKQTYTLVGWNGPDGSIARHKYGYVNTTTAGKCEGRLMRDAMPDDAIRVCSMIDSYQNTEGNECLKIRLRS